VVRYRRRSDNDIPYIEQSFGFQTAYAKATEAIRAAHVEATAVPTASAVVQLMGRHCGFIACYAALANNDADYVLIPEVPFSLDGEGGFLEHLRAGSATPATRWWWWPKAPGRSTAARAGAQHDKSGNQRLHDFGAYLRRRIQDDFAKPTWRPNLRYIDPSYRDPQRAGQPVRQRVLHPPGPRRCARRDGRPDRDGWSGGGVGRFVHVPMRLAIGSRNQVDPDGDLWMSVLEATGQPTGSSARVAARRRSTRCGPVRSRAPGRRGGHGTAGDVLRW